MSKRRRIVAGLAAEVIFAILPLLVVFMVLLIAQHPDHVFMKPEWSFGASILFGQALVRFVSGLAHGGRAATGPVALVVALIVVFGLAPSLFVLFWTLHQAESRILPGRWQQAIQVVLFCGASVMYMLLGVIGESWEKANQAKAS